VRGGGRAIAGSDLLLSMSAIIPCACLLEMEFAVHRYQLRKGNCNMDFETRIHFSRTAIFVLLLNLARSNQLCITSRSKRSRQSLNRFFTSARFDAKKSQTRMWLEYRLIIAWC